jgi:hypothetical protein
LNILKTLQSILKPDSSPLDQGKIFPDAYLTTENTQTTAKIASRKSLNTIFIWIVPSVMALILFLIYDRIIHLMTQNVLRNLH